MSDRAEKLPDGAFSLASRMLCSITGRGSAGCDGSDGEQEIAARLFISPRTVKWHLGNLFTKFGIALRKELR